MKEVVRRLIQIAKTDRKNWYEMTYSLISQTRNELFLVFGVTVHEYVWWQLTTKQMKLKESIKNLQLYKQKLIEENISIT